MSLNCTHLHLEAVSLPLHGFPFKGHLSEDRASFLSANSVTASPLQTGARRHRKLTHIELRST